MRLINVVDLRIYMDSTYIAYCSLSFNILYLHLAFVTKDERNLNITKLTKRGIPSIIPLDQMPWLIFSLLPQLIPEFKMFFW